MSGRVETGPIRFHDDWAGVFIRGDTAMYYAMLVEDAVREMGRNGDAASAIGLEGLATLLRSCQEPCEAMPALGRLEIGGMEDVDI